MKAALIVIDVQKAFFEEDESTTRSLNTAILYINTAIEVFRKKGLPVISVQHVNENENLVPGEEGFDLPDALQILPSDVHIHKTYGNAFNKTPLLEELRKQGIDTVFLTGFCAENCVLSTCRGAKDLDLTPILIRGALAGGHPERIKFVEEVNDLISLGALYAVLD
ncbi:MAG: isochorismatase family cysteine hydrolase [Anaerolineaceae bacterium]|jgi:nicotinamidase-related amidase|nr:isochorismatase family cysteine hydrolase [Anaerolineaceae bacterium]